MIKLNLSSSQKQQLLRLYNSSNDSFFTFLNSVDYEKKMKKLSNAKDAYAFYAYDEEPLFLLDDTDFGSADDGMVISNKSIYWRNTFGDPYEVKFEELYSCELVKEGGDSIFDDSGIMKINTTEIKMGYFKKSVGSIVNIINTLHQFYKENIIKEKKLDISSTISIPYTLAQSGGKFKDNVSGYDITIPKGVKDGTVWSWDGYGKSHGNIKGKLTVTVKVEPIIIKPKSKPTPKPVYKQEVKPKIKSEPKKIIVDCINCGKKHINPKSYDCSFCGKSLTKKVEVKKKKPTQLEVQIENDNSIDVEDLELIVTCVNCSKDIKNYSSHICPHCKEDANINKNSSDISGKKIHLEKINSLLKGLLIKKEKKELEKTSSPSEFYLNIDKDALVKDIKKQFIQHTGLVLRVYESSRKQARSNKKLINLATKKTTIKVTTRMKIETIIEEFQEVGVKVRIASSDDSKFCNSNFTLARAKEKDGG